MDPLLDREGNVARLGHDLKAARCGASDGRSEEGDPPDQRRDGYRQERPGIGAEHRGSMPETWKALVPGRDERLGSMAGQAEGAGRLSRPNATSSWSRGRKPTAARGAWPGANIATVGMLMIP